MIRILRLISKVTAALILTLILAIIFWYSQSFYPYLDELKVISDRGQNSLGQNQAQYYQYLRRYKSAQDIRSYATMRTYWSLVFRHYSKGKRYWYSNNTLWYLASFIHFDEHQIFAIWADCALYGCGAGLDKAAQIEYKKPLANISQQEFGKLALLIKYPQHQKRYQSQNRIRQLIENLKFAYEIMLSEWQLNG